MNMNHPQQDEKETFGFHERIAVSLPSAIKKSACALFTEYLIN
jgi:hypothetical protein